jgi:glycosyltransferase involved in cell wall biosynthesis
MNKPQITICMPVRNCSKTIATAILSIINQTYESWLLYVVDDGSIDDTYKILCKFSDRRIMVRRYEQSKGIAIRLNELIECVTTPYIARMDGDDIAFPDRLETQLNFMENQNDIDLLGTSMLILNFKGEPIGIVSAKPDHKSIIHGLWKSSGIAHPTYFGKTRWFRENPYNSNFMRSQDRELLLRTYQYSKFGNIDIPLVAYRLNNKFIKTIYKNRKFAIKAFLVAGVNNKTFLKMSIGIILQILKGVFDIICVLMKIENIKYKKIDTNQRKEWNCYISKLTKTY